MKFVKENSVNPKNKRLADIIGIGCAALVVLAAIASLLLGSMGKTAGLSNRQLPADALVLTGTAAGRNGDITVQIAVSQEQIYQVKIVDEAETKGYGSVAVTTLPGAIYEAQSLKVDGVAGATISSEAIKLAIFNALTTSELDPSVFGAAAVKVEKLANQVETGSGITLMTASQWSEEYPEVYASYLKNSENSEMTDYLVDYPMLPVLYENFGFARFYSSARGHYYDVHDIHETGRPHALANCYTCKTPVFTNMVNNMGDEAYALKFEEVTDVLSQTNEAISCYNCHANTPGQVTVTHSYLIDAVGEDFDKIDAATLACGQCHVEYYFDPVSKAVVLPHDSIESMSPDAILAFFNEELLVDGQGFADYTNPRTGVRQIKVQHPELETFLGEGSQHRATYTCADCHMGEAVAENGETYMSHYLTSPLSNEQLIAAECSACHADLVSEVREVQAAVEERTYAIGYSLEDLTELLAAAVASGEYTEEELNAIRALARDAQFYWDFVFVENSEGAHNSKLTHDCLDKAEALTAQAMALFK